MNYEKFREELRLQTNEIVCELSRLDGQTRGMLPIYGDNDFERLYNLVNDYKWLLEELKKYQTFDYKVQIDPDGPVLLDGKTVTPIKTLKNSEGGIVHIILEDNCFVLIRNEKIVEKYSAYFFRTNRWFSQAAAVLKSLV
jgi:hypothetical protein